jgi:hypothetical protein
MSSVDGGYQRAFKKEIDRIHRPRTANSLTPSIDRINKIYRIKALEKKKRAV